MFILGDAFGPNKPVSTIGRGRAFGQRLCVEHVAVYGLLISSLLLPVLTENASRPVSVSESVSNGTLFGLIHHT